MGPRPVTCKQDIPLMPAAHKATYVRIQDPARTECHLGKDSQSALRWLLSCVQFALTATTQHASSPALHVRSLRRGTRRHRGHRRVGRWVRSKRTPLACAHCAASFKRMCDGVGRAEKFVGFGFTRAVVCG